MDKENRKNKDFDFSTSGSKRPISKRDTEELRKLVRENIKIIEKYSRYEKVYN